VTTNTIEGFFSIFKRGMKGVYQHCDEKHLHRYLAEFDFRYNQRTALGVRRQRCAATSMRSRVSLASASRIGGLTSGKPRRWGTAALRRLLASFLDEP
jgi:hypothetical protein